MTTRLPIIHDGQPLVRRTLTVGEVARSAGKTVRALHLYEERGLLEPVDRSKGGYRLYGEEAVTRVRWIGKLQAMGFSLADIQEIVKRWERSGSAPSAMERVHELLAAKLAETRQQIAQLQELQGELESSLEYLETCPTCDPAQLLDACNACELHDKDDAPPELVAGFHAN
jgi:MerR family copper efflux transcriptional regulator